jgi:hypothetical protein
MTWTYVQRTGSLLHNGFLVGSGYAGRYTGKNNPDMQSVHETGPLPCGWYTIGPAYEHPTLGPVTMNLTPDASNEMFGRSEFRMHGDSAQHMGMASKGCIVQSRVVREHVDSLAKAGDNRLQVVAETPGERLT